MSMYEYAQIDATDSTVWMINTQNNFIDTGWRLI